MERGHEFSVDLPGEGTYVIKLLEGVQIEKTDGATIGRWPAFDLEANGDSEDEVYAQLLGSLRHKTGEPGSVGLNASSLSHCSHAEARFSSPRRDPSRCPDQTNWLLNGFTGGKMASGHPSRRRSGEGSAQCPAHG